MRGKVVYALRDCSQRGITPAYAGKRWCLSGWSAPPEDHPRVCGEKLYAMKPARAGKGSPPRMRGKVFFASVCVDFSGITPAYAGKSDFDNVRRGQAQDHPRVCGEKPTTKNTYHTARGSPPRMRGKGTSILQNLQRVGITPAYAGKRIFMNGTSLGTGDHPRVCGEKRTVSYGNVA